MKIYSLYDKVALTFNRPFPERSSATAMRALKIEVNRQDPSNNLFNSPQDYSLHHLGDFDEDTGVLTPQTPIALVTECITLKEQA